MAIRSFIKQSPIFSLFLNVVFLSAQIYFPSLSFAQNTTLNLPPPGTLVTQTKKYAPVIIRGVTINPNDPLKFDFVIDTGDTRLDGSALEEESMKLVKYFMAALTVPEQELWVNLSPYAPEQIIPNVLGETEMGRDLLAQDYILKQLTASLMHPEERLGNEFWARVQTKAQELFGTSNIPMNTFNKIWIVPDRAVVYEDKDGAYVVDSYLKVMLEGDYLALQDSLKESATNLGAAEHKNAETISDVSSQVVRELLIPEIEKEINTGKNFANLRQIYNSMILATWYKKALKESLLGQVYANQNKSLGVDVEDKAIKQKIYQQYIEAFKQGAYNYTKEEYDPATRQIIPKEYFSGGFDGADLSVQVGEQTLNPFKKPLSPEQRTVVLEGSKAASPVSRIVNMSVSFKPETQNGMQAATLVEVLRPAEVKRLIQEDISIPEPDRKAALQEYDQMVQRGGTVSQSATPNLYKVVNNPTTNVSRAPASDIQVATFLSTTTPERVISAINQSFATPEKKEAAIQAYNAIRNNDQALSNPQVRAQIPEAKALDVLLSDNQSGFKERIQSSMDLNSPEVQLKQSIALLRPENVSLAVSQSNASPEEKVAAQRELDAARSNPAYLPTITVRENSDSALGRMLANPSTGLAEQINSMTNMGTINKQQVQAAGLDWTDVSQKLTQNGLAKQQSPTQVALTVSPEENQPRVSEVFGDNFSKVMPVLQSATDVNNFVANIQPAQVKKMIQNSNLPADKRLAASEAFDRISADPQTLRSPEKQAANKETAPFREFVETNRDFIVSGLNGLAAAQSPEQRMDQILPQMRTEQIKAVVQGLNIPEVQKTEALATLDRVATNSTILSTPVLRQEQAAPIQKLIENSQSGFSSEVEKVWTQGREDIRVNQMLGAMSPEAIKAEVRKLDIPQTQKTEIMAAVDSASSRPEILANNALRQASPELKPLVAALENKQSGLSQRIAQQAPTFSRPNISSAAKQSLQAAPGGIDFNAALLSMQVQKDGKGVVLPVNQQPMLNAPIDGFVPVLNGVKSLPGIPLSLPNDVPARAQ
jgi:hypothetical protein